MNPCPRNIAILRVIAYLAVTVRPKVYHHAHDVIQSCIRPLIHQYACHRPQWQEQEPRLNTPMYHGASKWFERILERACRNAKYQIQSLYDGYWFECAVQVVGEEIEKHFGPEVAF